MTSEQVARIAETIHIRLDQLQDELTRITFDQAAAMIQGREQVFQAQAERVAHALRPVRRAAFSTMAELSGVGVDPDALTDAIDRMRNHSIQLFDDALRAAVDTLVERLMDKAADGDA